MNTYRVHLKYEVEITETVEAEDRESALKEVKEGLSGSDFMLNATIEYQTVNQVER